MFDVFSIKRPFFWMEISWHINSLHSTRCQRFGIQAKKNSFHHDVTWTFAVFRGNSNDPKIDDAEICATSFSPRSAAMWRAWGISWCDICWEKVPIHRSQVLAYSGREWLVCFCCHTPSVYHKNEWYGETITEPASDPVWRFEPNQNRSRWVTVQQPNDKNNEQNRRNFAGNPYCFVFN